MKAIIHYDTGDTFHVILWNIPKTAIWIRFYLKGEPYVLGQSKFAELGIIRVTHAATGKILWSLNRGIKMKEAQKNLPDFSWIEDDFTRNYCENNFVNDETIELLKEPGNVLRGHIHDGNIILVYSLNEGRYLVTDPIDKIYK